MTENMSKQPDDKTNVIDLSAKRKQQRQKAKQKASGDGGFDLGDLSLKDIGAKLGSSQIGTFLQLVVFMVLLFFFMRSCGF